MSEKNIYIDENGKSKFDFTKAQSVFEPHPLANMYGEFLSDVDFVIEDDNQMILMEYKNACIPGTANSEVLYKKVQSSNEKFWKTIAKKFYGTMFLVWATGRNVGDKKVKYVLLIETTPSIDRVLKKRLKEKMLSLLPFKYKQETEIKREVITEFEIMDLLEWRKAYPDYRVSIAEE